MMDFDLDQFIDTFFEEAVEHVASLEASLLGLEANPEDRELMNAAFRAAHSLKGSSAIFGLTNISRFTHILENVLDRVRNGTLAWERNIATLFFQSVDVIRELLDVKGAHLSRAGEDLIVELSVHGSEDATNKIIIPLDTPNTAGTPQGEDDAFTVQFRPFPQIFERGTNILLILRELDDVAAILNVETDTSALPPLDKLDPTLCYIGWTFSVRCAKGVSALNEVFEFVTDQATVTIVPTNGAPKQNAAQNVQSAAIVSPPASAPHASLMPAPAPALARKAPIDDDAFADDSMSPGPRLSGKPSLLPNSFQRMSLMPGSERAAAWTPGNALKAATAPGGNVQAAPSDANKAPPKAGNAPAAATNNNDNSTVRIATKKLDKILDILGEVVIAKSMISQGLRTVAASTDLRDALVTLERQTRELQDSVMSVRMVPIQAVFSRFSRMVRELGAKLEKNIQLVMEGTETEIDRAMVEQLADPLTHLVRNAVDHGIEKPADRVAAGKPEAGTLRLSASHRGGNVVVEIIDDGRGLDLERVKAKAISRGLLAPNANPSVEELHMLIFEPGFSTADAITDISGRGVGMDVVQKNVRALGGSIRFTSEPGRGSTILLQLPLTMAIIDGLLLRVGGGTFVVPLRSVVESLRPTASQINYICSQARVLKFRDETIPLVALSEVLEIQGGCTDATEGIVIVVESGNATIGIIVDELAADTQVVVKSLESNYKALDGISGATVLGDGTIALILDIGALARNATSGRVNHIREAA